MDGVSKVIHLKKLVKDYNNFFFPLLINGINS